MTAERNPTWADIAAGPIRNGDLRPVVSELMAYFPSVSGSGAVHILAELETAGVIGPYVEGSEREIFPAAETQDGDGGDPGDDLPVGITDGGRPEDPGESDAEPDFEIPQFEPTDWEAEVLESETGACPNCGRALFAGGPATYGEYPLWCDTCREPVELEDIALPEDAALEGDE